MNYEEWLKSTEFGLRRRYKVKGIVFTDLGMRIDFVNNFHYGIYEYSLKDLWQNNGFNKLCDEIEREYLKQIINY